MAPAADIEDGMDSDMFRSANDHINRALDEAAAGESIKQMAMIGGLAFLLSGIGGFVVGAIVVKIAK